MRGDLIKCIDNTGIRGLKTEYKEPCSNSDVCKKQLLLLRLQKKIEMISPDLRYPEAGPLGCLRGYNWLVGGPLWVSHLYWAAEGGYTISSYISGGLLQSQGWKFQKTMELKCFPNPTERLAKTGCLGEATLSFPFDYFPVAHPNQSWLDLKSGNGHLQISKLIVRAQSREVWAWA